MGLFLKGVRLTGRPEKQLLWFWVYRDMKKSEGHQTGLDLACGPMQSKPDFRTKAYIGVDCVASEVEAGLKLYPDVKGIVSTIEEMPDELDGDFVVCLQTIGTNRYFKKENTLIVMDRLLKAVKPGGCLMVNVGPDSLDPYGPDIASRLNRSFEKVKCRRYGAFHEERSITASLLLAIMMYFIPPFRHGKYRCRYYFCQGKKGQPQSRPKPADAPAVELEETAS